MRDIRTFFQFLESKKDENTHIGHLAKRVIADVAMGNGCCFLGKNINVGNMIRYLNSRNTPEQLVAALKDAFNAWNKFQEDERKEAHKAYKPKLHKF